jgi:peptidoglycan/LPS O-acetylase OafA/YrhL
MLALPDKLVTPTHFRPDIQGLRAVAVVLVMIFHFWPGYLPGGYIGVDVFFVISGYLITGILARELEKHGSISVLQFYGRRIRRLVPCATVVLTVTAALTIFLLPATQWRNVVHGILASALYVENWDLIHKSANYLNAFFPPTPVQHFWSLSVEGQFYAFWPFVIALADRLVLRGRFRGPVPIVVFSGIAAFSFFGGLIICYQASVPAYFSTLTRIWELALGGAVVFIEQANRPTTGRSVVFGWLGVISILAAGATLSNHTLFPGYAALLPTCGAGLVILAGGNGSPLCVSRYLATAPLRYVGDISYSMYLWHWPIVIFAKEIWGEIGFAEGLLLFALCVTLSHGTWTYVEKPFYSPKDSNKRLLINGPWLGLICTSLSITFALGLFGYLKFLQQNGISTAVDSTSYPGALALAPGFGGLDIKRPFIPSALNAKYDSADTESNGCEVPYSDYEAKGCRYGVAGSAVKVALVGDSHAEQWLPALDVIAGLHPMEITVYVKSHCAFSAELQFLFEEGRPYRECSEWTRRLLDKLKRNPPSLLITGEVNGYQVVGSPSDEEESSRRMAGGYIAIWNELGKAGIPLVAIADTPFMPFDVPDCLARRGATVQKCSVAKSKALKSYDPLVDAAARDKMAKLVDMNDLICGPDICSAVVGNVLVYQDSNHLTRTYARTLAPMLDERIGLDNALGDGSTPGRAAKFGGKFQ